MFHTKYLFGAAHITAEPQCGSQVGLKCAYSHCIYVLTIGTFHTVEDRVLAEALTVQNLARILAIRAMLLLYTDFTPSTNGRSQSSPSCIQTDPLPHHKPHGFSQVELQPGTKQPLNSWVDLAVNWAVLTVSYHDLLSKLFLTKTITYII
jgi:hypothetical protein